jgi:antitoxin HigA-1
MNNRKRPPAHPGALIRRQYIEPLGLTITSLSESLNVSRKTLSKIVNEHANVTTDMALRLSRAFSTTPELWLNLQTSYDLWHSLHSVGEWKSIKKIHLVPAI